VSGRATKWAFLGAGAILTLPALLVRRPPVLDLPQLLEQVVLLGRVLAGREPELELHAAGPNRLGYLFVLLARAAGGDAWGPRLAVAFAVAAWVASVAWICVRLDRPLAAGLLATTLAYSSLLYAGFFNFLAGVVPLAYWAVELRREPARSPAWAIALRSFAGALLLYAAHALWLVVGGFAVATWVLLVRFSRREVLARAAGVAPVVALALAWSGELAAGGWQSNVRMVFAPLDRLTSPRFLTTVFWGGLEGWVEIALFGVLVLWLAGSCVVAWRTRGRGAESFLLLFAGLALLLVFLAPGKVDHTVLFAWRWGPFAALALLLGAPAPLPARVATAAAAVVLVFALATARAWRGFEREDLGGFESALAAVPEGGRVLGLDFVRRSPRFKVQPYLQMFAYAGVERRAATSFSFAEVASSLVTYRELPRPRAWTPSLESFPFWARESDLDSFDVVLFHGDERASAWLAERLPGLVPVAGEGRWWLLARPARAAEGR
jgi:hypothetical protein